MKKSEAKREIARLVKKLDSLSGPEFKKYDEENTKKDFILPLFRALGWAVEDRREVTAEDKVSRRRVDYAFRIEGIPKFFLEAKRLKADLDNPEYAWQAINYAWTKGVTWGVLTDFEGLKVFNAQWKGPSLLYNRFVDIPYTEYLERFDELWLLSRHSFEEGLLDIEAEKVGKKAKREAVGKELFDDLIIWRQRLYRQLRGWKENKKYSEAEIDEAVQRILDRLIFIRTAEDRELEERILLPAAREWRENGGRKELDKALARIFRDFDKKYDSELFEGHFCEDLVCDSTTYASVIEGLYGMRDEVPTYNFDAIDVDVLGGIYEQYLSYRQGLPEEVEQAKRRRRKKRGIYYTPKFVVQYIVENTVGRLLQERSHDEIRKLRILDPACGSGSFLIEAFDRLDRYHQEARGTAQRSDEKAAQDDFLERLRILRDNIYGVDLDPQAAEIARLNLLLKTLYQRALLPKLEDNIRCGNSLISGIPIELSQYFGPDWEAKRPFNWEEEFRKIMEEGGFDVVIGNPPYVANVGFSAQEKEYHRAKFESATGKYDLYMLFIERGLALCKPSGYFSYIVPNKFMQTRAGKGLRKYILANSEILEILDFGDTGVFRDAMNYPCILILRKNGRAKSVFFLHKKANGYPDRVIEESSVDQDRLSEDVWIFAPTGEMELYERLVAQNPPLQEWVERIFTGVQSGADKLLVFNAEECKRRKYEKEMLRPILRGRDIKRYSVRWGGKYIFYPYMRKQGTYQIVGERELKKNSALYSHLSSHRTRLSERVWFGQAAEELSGAWYGLMYIGDPKWFTSRKLITPALSAIPNFTLGEERYLFFTGTAGGYGLILSKEFDSKEWYFYLLGVLNSKVTEFCIKKVSPMFSGGFYKFNTQYLKPLPIRGIDFDNPQDVKMHDALVALVERMLDLHKRVKDAKGEEKKNLERQIARTDRKIDNLVYQLYDITEEERKIIEGKM